MLKTPTSKSAGFTLTELMIVLAVAAIILMLVFEAIPALVRSSRNNQRKQDVQTILETISHYELNNSGDVPQTGPLRTSLGSVKLSYYVPTDVTVTFSSLDSTSSIATNPLQLDSVQIYNHGKCDTANPGQGTNVAAGYSDVIALYSVESGKNTIGPQCQEL